MNPTILGLQDQGFFIRFLHEEFSGFRDFFGLSSGFGVKGCTEAAGPGSALGFRRLRAGLQDQEVGFRALGFGFRV